MRYLEEFFFASSVALALAAVAMLPHTITSDDPWVMVQLVGGASVCSMLVALVLKYCKGNTSDKG